MVQPSHSQLTKRPIMSRFVVSLPSINTANLPCIPQPLRSPLCSPRMPSRSKPVSFTGTLIALYRSLVYNTSISSSLRHQTRSRKLMADRQQFMPPKARQIFGVDEVVRPIYYPSFDLGQAQATDSPSTATTPSTLCGTAEIEDRTILEPPKLCVVLKNQHDSAPAGVSATTILHYASLQLNVKWIVRSRWKNHGVPSARV